MVIATHASFQRRALEEATGSVSKGKVTIRASGKAIEKSEAAVVAGQEELEATAAALETAKNEYRGIEEAALRVMETYKATQEVLEGKKESMLSIEGKYEAARKAVGKLRAAQVDTENELQNATKDLKESRAKAEHLQAKWQELKEEHDATAAEFAASFEEEPAKSGEAAAGAGEAPARIEDAMEVEGGEAAGGSEEQAAAEPAAGPHVSGMVEWGPEVLDKFQVQGVKYEITMLEEAIGRMSPNMAAIAEWRRKERECRERRRELDEATDRRDAARSQLDGLRKQVCVSFLFLLELFAEGLSFLATRSTASVAPFTPHARRPAAAGRVYGGLRGHHDAAQGDVPDDHAGRRRRA